MEWAYQGKRRGPVRPFSRSTPLEANDRTGEKVIGTEATGGIAGQEHHGRRAEEPEARGSGRAEGDAVDG